jgi:hypothetical protein
VKLYGADNVELLEVTSLGRQDNQLIIRGKAFGAMPITARLTPREARAALRLLRPGMLLFLLSLPFRRRAR